MPALYFGPPWDAPVTDDGIQVDTPTGTPCGLCSEPIIDGDQGFIRPYLNSRQQPNPHRPVVLESATEPVHRGCEALVVVGHLFGVCGCTGHETTKANGELLLDRMNRMNDETAADHAGSSSIAVGYRDATRTRTAPSDKEPS